MTWTVGRGTPILDPVRGKDHSLTRDLDGDIRGCICYGKTTRELKFFEAVFHPVDIPSSDNGATSPINMQRWAQNGGGHVRAIPYLTEGTCGGKMEVTRGRKKKVEANPRAIIVERGMKVETE